MTIVTRWVDGAGYRPVQVSITPTVPTTADKTFTLEFLFRRRYLGNDQYDLRIKREIELPAGSGPVQATVLLPRYPDCDEYAINILEDGELQQSLCTQWTGSGTPPTDWGECLPAFLFVGDTVHDTTQLGALLPLQYYGGSQIVRRYNRGPMPILSPQSVGQAPGFSQELPNLVSCSVAELPQRWLAYSSLDVVCLSLGQFEELAEKNPPALEAVLRWTAAGGNLWVYGMGQDWRRVGRLEDLLGVPPGDAASRGPVARGWSQPGEDVYHKPLQGVLAQPPAAERVYVETPEPDGTVTVTEADYNGSGQLPAGKAPLGPHVVLREYELGLVVAFASGDPFPGTVDEWRGVLNAVGPDRWLWYRRHGVSMLRENEDYWNFLIPGVGLVPVTEFCVLITLFVLAIGPLNYWLLRRWKRLHLLVVTIPLGAATVTLLMFGYAFLADGLGTRVRVRSVTRLDQGRGGQAVCWARLSYYAGLAPRRGLAFPDDVAVLPLEYLPAPDYQDGPVHRDMIWDDGPGGQQQRFVSGWLNSRTPMQLLTVRSRQSSLGLELIRPAAAGGLPSAGRGAASPQGRLRVKNRLGTRIQQLVVRTDDGNCYWAEGIGRDQIVALGPFTPQAQAELRQAYRDSWPQMPEAVQSRYSRSGGIFGLRYYRRFYGSNPALTPPTQQTSRLEASLAELGTLAGGDLSPLEPNSYVAVVEESPEVEAGIVSAREEAGYHVIWGKW